MWGRYAGPGFHYPAFMPHPAFYFPPSDTPLTPEEFARQQALARQQEQLRRRSSGLSEEPRTRAASESHKDSPRSLSKSSTRVGSAVRHASCKPDVSASPSAREAWPEDEDVALPPSVATRGVAPFKALLAKPASDFITAHESRGQSAVSTSSAHQEASDGLADLDSELEDSAGQKHARSPLSSLSGLPSWGSLTSSASDHGLDEADGDESAMSQPHADNHHTLGIGQHASIPSSPQEGPAAAANVPSDDGPQAEDVEFMGMMQPSDDDRLDCADKKHTEGSPTGHPEGQPVSISLEQPCQQAGFLGSIRQRSTPEPSSQSMSDGSVAADHMSQQDTPAEQAAAASHVGWQSQALAALQIDGCDHQPGLDAAPGLDAPEDSAG